MGTRSFDDAREVQEFLEVHRQPWTQNSGYISPTRAGLTVNYFVLNPGSTYRMPMERLNDDA